MLFLYAHGWITRTVLTIMECLSANTSGFWYKYLIIRKYSNRLKSATIKYGNTPCFVILNAFAFSFQNTISRHDFFFLFVLPYLHDRSYIQSLLTGNSRFLAMIYDPRFANRRGVPASKGYALRAVIALTTSIQLRDKVCTRVANWRTGNSRSRNPGSVYSCACVRVFHKALLVATLVGKKSHTDITFRLMSRATINVRKICKIYTRHAQRAI